MSEIKCEYASRHYDVPADIGRCVTVDGRPGVITEDRGNYIGVTFDSEPTEVYPCHPTWKVEYGELLPVRKAVRMTRSQQRYQRYLRSETSESFSKWLGIPKGNG